MTRYNLVRASVHGILVILGVLLIVLIFLMLLAGIGAFAEFLSGNDAHICGIAIGNGSTAEFSFIDEHTLRIHSSGELLLQSNCLLLHSGLVEEPRRDQ